jgi:predicted HicB family RNase H-like nuclease
MKTLNVRLPDDIHAALVTMAEQDDRSLNNMIVALIRNECDHRASRG